jgi:hypothetical protein
MDAFFRMGASLSDRPALGNYLMEIEKYIIIRKFCFNVAGTLRVPS